MTKKGIHKETGLYPWGNQLNQLHGDAITSQSSSPRCKINPTKFTGRDLISCIELKQLLLIPQQSFQN